MSSRVIVYLIMSFLQRQLWLIILADFCDINSLVDTNFKLPLWNQLGNGVHNRQLLGSSVSQLWQGSVWSTLATYSHSQIRFVALICE